MTALLDVNVLLSLAWPNHVHHERSARWFTAPRRGPWATCPLTESGFVRISANRRVLPDARRPEEAAAVLRALCSLDGHTFWVDDVALVDCPEIDDLSLLSGYRQVTDAHLTALTARRGGRLVTYDRAAAELAERHGVGVELLTS